MSEESQVIDKVTILHPQSDWFLQSLVSMANRGEINVGVTLQVGGFLVSGQLIAGDVYFKSFSEVFASGISDPEVRPSFSHLFDVHGEIYTKSTDEQLGPPSYIHLSNARFFHPGGKAVPNNEGILWRGRISQVDGFNLGSLSSN